MAAVLRRLAAIPVLLTAGAMLAGCGRSAPVTSSGKPTAKVTTTKRAPSAPAHGGAHAGGGRARAQALAFAQAVNLRARDVAGFGASRTHEHTVETAAEKRLGRELRACAGGAGGESKGLAEASSPEFERKASIASQSVSSQVTVYASPALAAKELASFRSGRLRACLSRYFSALLSGKKSHGTSVSGVSTRYGSPPALGTTGSFGLRVTAKLSFQGIQLPFYLDYLVFVEGSAEVALRSLGTPVPFPANVEERLFSLLVARAKAHRS